MKIAIIGAGNVGGDFRPEVLFAGGGITYFYISDFHGNGWPNVVGNDIIRRQVIVFLNDSQGK
jgi:malate/lactate dehydrogenase